jgi:hypothetical protein
MASSGIVRIGMRAQRQQERRTGHPQPISRKVLPFGHLQAQAITNVAAMVAIQTKTPPAAGRGRELHQGTAGRSGIRSKCENRTAR